MVVSQAMGNTLWPGQDPLGKCVRLNADTTPCRTVVDPFCGVGSMLAVANRHGLAAIGVEMSPSRAERARTLELGAKLLAQSER